MNRTHGPATALLAVIALGALVTGSAAAADAAAPTRVDQGPNWTAVQWRDFYSRDQGARIMPLAWMTALKQPNGEAFLANSLSRYGYLPNPESPTPGLAVGFTTNDYQGVTAIGMTCAACHTRQITVEGTSYRIDGGPAIVDFQAFLADLDTAVAKVLGSDAVLLVFATDVLGHKPSQDELTTLKASVTEWYGPYHTLMERALPNPPWGVARLDAVAMIFNRLTGLDIGAKKDNYVIPENIQKASAPVRYPFLWNAPIQDMTQWPGFAENGNELLGLARNLGEVYGVFGEMHPKSYVLFVDYLATNSANFGGLLALEKLIAPDSLGSPKWPWPLDAKRVAAGKAIFDRPTGSGGCGECHDQRAGATRFPNQATWATPILDVGTDSHEHDILTWSAKTGVLEGARKPVSFDFYGKCDSAFKILSNTVVGSILQRASRELAGVLGKEDTDAMAAFDAKAIARFDDKLKGVLSRPEYEFLKTAFNQPASQTAVGPCQPEDADSASKTAKPIYAYESRVMDGIWAAAPYLHNGSVPTLWDLLQPVQDRPAEFAVGPAYDTAKVGLAAKQTIFKDSLKTTDCYDRNSGNSRCGHEYGTSLTVEEKKALLEYLKSL
ncbi:MAG: hypothetical protein GC191_02260 [Azospirillum sp.]|nr:hypothetical protein [Azospirillum sp.]